ncbi:hypothetical protein [Streptomyces sp. NPDC058861]|uniref:hypothetical protein n=1 Tax=Streptomyces sp. NPDC058861 TaxID=3346653 RepID=UPI0036CFE789
MSEPSTTGTGPALCLPLKPSLRKLRTDPARFELSCPACGEDLGEHRFESMARRVFSDHADEHHPAPSPLELIRGAVVLEAGGPDRWTCDVNGETYAVRLPAAGRYVVDAVTREVSVRASLRSLPQAQITIASMAGVATPALVEAATLQLKRQDASCADLPSGEQRGGPVADAAEDSLDRQE